MYQQTPSIRSEISRRSAFLLSFHQVCVISRSPDQTCRFGKPASPQQRNVIGEHGGRAVKAVAHDPSLNACALSDRFAVGWRDIVLSCPRCESWVQRHARHGVVPGCHGYCMSGQGGISDDTCQLGTRRCPGYRLIKVNSHRKGVEIRTEILSRSGTAR
jgi:hypothetical protein